MKSGSLNLLEPSGPHRACYGTALPLPLPFIYSRERLKSKYPFNVIDRLSKSCIHYECLRIPSTYSIVFIREKFTTFWDYYALFRWSRFHWFRKCSVFMARQPPLGLGLIIVEVSTSHSSTTHSVELLWTNDRPDAVTSTAQHTALTKDTHPRSRRGSNPQSEQRSSGRPTTDTARPHLESTASELKCE
jgi:hypothetical protein